MKKCILGILTACAAMPAFADRIGDLEARLAQLEHRVAVLESGGNTVKIDLFGSNSTMYVCSVTPFQKTFEASDRNEGVARQKVRQACNRFADRIGDLEARLAQLEHRVAVLESGGNTVKIDLFGSNSTMYVCSVTPFQKTFEASDRNEGVARQKVRQACNRETSAMFCEDEAIRCRKFD